MSVEETAAELKMEIPTHRQIKAFEEVNYLYIPKDQQYEKLTQEEIEELIREESLLQCYPKLAEALKFEQNQRKLEIKEATKQEDTPRNNDSDSSPLHSDEEIVLYTLGHHVPRNGIIEYNGEKIKVRRRIRHRKPQMDHSYNSEEEHSQIFKHPVAISNNVGRFDMQGRYQDPFQLERSNIPKKFIISESGEIIPKVLSSNFNSNSMALQKFSFKTENPYYINNDGDLLFIKRCKNAYSVTMHVFCRGEILNDLNEFKCTACHEEEQDENSCFDGKKHNHFVIDYRLIEELGYRKMSWAEFTEFQRQQECLKRRLKIKEKNDSSQSTCSRCD